MLPPYSGSCRGSLEVVMGHGRPNLSWVFHYKFSLGVGSVGDRNCNQPQLSGMRPKSPDLNLPGQRYEVFSFSRVSAKFRTIKKIRTNFDHANLNPPGCDSSLGYTPYVSLHMPFQKADNERTTPKCFGDEWKGRMEPLLVVRTQTHAARTRLPRIA